MLSPLSLSRYTTFPESSRNLEENKEEGARRDAQKMHAKEVVLNCNVGVPVVEPVQSWSMSGIFSAKFFPTTVLWVTNFWCQNFWWRPFGYLECDFEVPELLKNYFWNVPPIFKNTIISRTDIGNLMREYGEKEGVMAQPTRKLLSSLHLPIDFSLLLYFFLTCNWVLYEKKNSSIRWIHCHKVL